MTRLDLSRRNLLGGVVATRALAVTGGLALPTPTASANTTGRPPSTADVVVVGWGISGLVAA